MKKIISIICTLVISAMCLTGCTTSVYDDFETYMNVEMTELNENYEKFKAETGTWENLEDDASIINSIEKNLLPIVNDSLQKLENITPETEEVQEIKAKYVKVMEAYKDGFTDILAGMKELDESKLTSGNEKVDNGIKLLNEYNAALEALAAEVGATIEY